MTKKEKEIIWPFISNMKFICNELEYYYQSYESDEIKRLYKEMKDAIKEVNKLKGKLWD